MLYVVVVVITIIIIFFVLWYIGFLIVFRSSLSCKMWAIIKAQEEEDFLHIILGRKWSLIKIQRISMVSAQ